MSPLVQRKPVDRGHRSPMALLLRPALLKALLPRRSCDSLQRPEQQPNPSQHLCTPLPSGRHRGGPRLDKDNPARHLKQPGRSRGSSSSSPHRALRTVDEAQAQARRRRLHLATKHSRPPRRRAHHPRRAPPLCLFTSRRQEMRPCSVSSMISSIRYRTSHAGVAVVAVVVSAPPLPLGRPTQPTAPPVCRPDRVYWSRPRRSGIRRERQRASMIRVDLLMPNRTGRLSAEDVHLRQPPLAFPRHDRSTFVSRRPGSRPCARLHPHGALYL
jgi:hypothetical protein